MIEKRVTGRYIINSTAGESVKAFVPNPLPPIPPLDISSSLRVVMDEALIALGRLDAASALLPDINLLLYAYVRKEAVLSSQIEGTQSSLSDLLLFELDGIPGVPVDDVKEVSNYVAAMEYGIKRLKDGFPLSSRFFRELHGILLRSGRGAKSFPGEFRLTQNWIGGSRPGNAKFVPPPPEEVPECIGELEQFLHGNRGEFGALVKAALAHVQFETIHPFCDGNGRVGRLLVALIFLSEGVLSQPLLFISLYFKRNRAEYYQRLDAVRTEGCWEEWLEYFSLAVRDTATSAASTAKRLSSQIATDFLKVKELGRITDSALRVFREFVRSPINNSARIVIATGLVPNTVNKCLTGLVDLGLLREITGRQRSRVYTYTNYLAIMEEES